MLFPSLTTSDLKAGADRQQNKGNKSITKVSVVNLQHPSTIILVFWVTATDKRRSLTLCRTRWSKRQEQWTRQDVLLWHYQTRNSEADALMPVFICKPESLCVFVKRTPLTLPASLSAISHLDLNLPSPCCSLFLWGNFILFCWSNVKDSASTSLSVIVTSKRSGKQEQQKRLW